MDNVNLKKRLRVSVSKNFHWDFNNQKQKYVLLDKRSGKECNPDDINTKITVYEDRVKEWFLNIGDRLKQDNESGFVILQIAIAYIEGNQQLRRGSSSKRKSEKFFIEAMKRIFSLSNRYIQLCLVYVTNEL